MLKMNRSPLMVANLATIYKCCTTGKNLTCGRNGGKKHKGMHLIHVCIDIFFTWPNGDMPFLRGNAEKIRYLCGGS